MVSLAALWLPTIVATVVVFIMAWSLTLKQVLDGLV